MIHSETVTVTSSECRLEQQKNICTSLIYHESFSKNITNIAPIQKRIQAQIFRGEWRFITKVQLKRKIQYTWYP